MRRVVVVELSSLDVHFLARELTVLEDAYVDQVYQTAPDEYYVRFRKPKAGAFHLRVRPGAFVALSPVAPETPETPGSTAMTLRKHLGGARLRRIDQHEFDRILLFRFDAKGEPHLLAVELFGKGNVILADAADRILMAHRTETFSHRTVRRGEALKFPPARVNPKTLARSEFDQLVAKARKDVVRFLATDLGLGGDLAEEVAHRAGVDKASPASKVVESEVARLWEALQGLLRAPVTVAVARGADRTRLSAVAFQSQRFQPEVLEGKASLSEAIVAWAAEEARAVPAAPDEERERLQRQLEHQEKAIRVLEEEANRWERRGNLLFEHYADVHTILADLAALGARETPKRFAQVLKAPPPGSAWAGRIVRHEPEHGRVVIRVADEEIRLDPAASLERNANLVYDEAKRVRAKAEGARAALDETRKRIQARPLPVPAKAKPPRAPAKRFWFEAHRWFYTSDGFLVVGGRDAAGNEKLVKRHLHAGDVYAHADFHGAPSCVIKTNGAAPPPSTLAEACQFAATYSRAFAQFAQADAYWVRPEQVSKTAESGEYVPKGAFIVRGQRSYHPKMKLEAALGLVRLTKEGTPGGPEAPYPRLMGGPEAALRARAPRYVVVERGELKPADAAKQLAPVFGVTLEEVQAALPPGPIRLGPLREAKR